MHNPHIPKSSVRDENPPDEMTLVESFSGD